MWNWADDYGVGEWTVRELLGFAFPNDEDVTNAEFQCLCTEVATCFNTVFYTVGGRRFYCIPAWDDHQKNERRAQGKYPRPDDPEAVPDQAFTRAAEKHGKSVQPTGNTAPGTGNREQGTGEQGNRGMAPREPDIDLTALFEAAYSHWPKKVKRDEAFDRFKTACKREQPEQLAQAIADFGNAYAATTEKQFIPALGPWIYQKRWTDELPTAQGRKPTRTEQNLDFVQQLAREQEQKQRSIEGATNGR